MPFRSTSSAPRRSISDARRFSNVAPYGGGGSQVSVPSPRGHASGPCWRSPHSTVSSNERSEISTSSWAPATPSCPNILDLRRRLEYLENGACTVHPISFRAADECDDAGRLQAVDRTLSGCERDAKPLRQPIHGPVRVLDKQVDGTLRQPRRTSRKLAAPVNLECVDALDARERVIGLPRRSLQKIPEPLLPFAALGDAEQARIILRPRCVEPGAEIEQRR